MGIRFYCPNGHKLNVKEFQAGLKGICPYCGVKIQIPTESTRPSSKAEKEAPAGDVPAAQQAAPPDKPPPEAAEPADPLVEAGDAVWYVRPPGGGQFGPAGPDVMKTWIAEGRVSPDCLVWREGWGDWREASQVFPPLAAGGTESLPVRVFTGETSLSNTTASGATTTGGIRPGRRRKSKNSQAVVIILLIFAVLILSAVFIWVLTK